ncbi:WD40/YVTN/BNR-like repeat-containing protein [Paraconexibacter algicola]|uniref:Exo-alpha-sialidase n=1 Tax=Paraconexibacter algicola TaxID=2133960 RepID=A0A2T4UM38_9ACTN|nr:hypothetical protein [Paraconexibacter algicola]PTL60295.1 hypothetical protein C7Y72_11920 [Paraconexibacter algicola]
MQLRTLRALVSFLALAALAGCGQAERKSGLVAVDPVGHVHAVGFDPQDRSILVAAHRGLFRAASDATSATPVGDERRDVMGFSVEKPGRYVGSGHPDLRQGGPTSVGFIRSSDGGAAWETVSLEGRADLHAIEVAGNRVYAFDALSGKLLRSRDSGATWSSTTVPPVLDLAVDPVDADRLVASTEQGVLVSTDGGRGFRPVVDLPLSHLTWGSDGITAVGGDQVVQRISGDLRTINQHGRAPIVPAATTETDFGLLVAGDDGSVYTSRDGGRTWDLTLEPIR